MRKRFFTILLVSIIGCACFTSQADIWKSIGKGLKKVDKTLNKVDNALKGRETSNSHNSNSNTPAKKKRSKDGVIQQGITTIDTGHHDFKINIKRCEAAGSTVVIDMVFENVGANDVYPYFFGGTQAVVAGPNKDTSYAYDDEGNKYTGINDFKFRIGNSDFTDNRPIHEMLPVEIPIKGRIQLDGVPESANSLKKINFVVRCDEWGINSDYPVIITNLPIQREGED